MISCGSLRSLSQQAVVEAPETTYDVSQKNLLHVTIQKAIILWNELD